MDRRKFIKNAAMVGGASSLIGCAAQTHAIPPSRLLDFSKPEDNIYGLLKLMGDLSGKRTYYYQPGRVFVHEDGKLPQHIMNYTGATMREIRKIDEDTYVSQYSGWQLFRDAKTNAIIDKWGNPATGELKNVKHFEFKKSKQSFSVDGFKRPKGFTGDFVWFEKPFVMPWQVIEDQVWAPFEQFSRYTNREGHRRYENAIHTYSGRLSDLQNTKLTSAPSTIASQSQSPFYHWMGYGDKSGHLISTSLGTKSYERDIIPKAFQNAIETRYPGAFQTVFEWS